MVMKPVLAKPVRYELFDDGVLALSEEHSFVPFVSNMQ